MRGCKSVDEVTVWVDEGLDGSVLHGHRPDGAERQVEKRSDKGLRWWREPLRESRVGPWHEGREHVGVSRKIVGRVEVASPALEVEDGHGQPERKGGPAETFEGLVGVTAGW